MTARNDWTIKQLDFVLLGVFVTLAVGLVHSLYSRKQDIRITRLFVHPVKGCKGTSVQSWEYTPQGLKHDRRYAIVRKDTHKFVSGRDIPKMILIHPVMERFNDENCEGILRIRFPDGTGLPEVTVPLEPKKEILKNWNRVEDVRIWSATTDAYICKAFDGNSRDPAEVISEYLGIEVMLVYKGPGIRSIEQTPTHPSLEGSASFQDQFPLLLASEESLVDVQRKIAMSAMGASGWEIKGFGPDWDGQLTMERFRPNIIIEGAKKPFAEEDWEEITFFNDKGTAYGTTMCVMKCGRCQVPNIEPSTGIRHEHVPFKVLAKYRRVEPLVPSNVCFGVHGVPKESGTYRVGDRVRVSRYLPPVAEQATTA